MSSIVIQLNNFSIKNQAGKKERIMQDPGWVQSKISSLNELPTLWRNNEVKKKGQATCEAVYYILVWKEKKKKNSLYDHLSIHFFFFSGSCSL